MVGMNTHINDLRASDVIWLVQNIVVLFLVSWYNVSRHRETRSTGGVERIQDERQAHLQYLRQGV